MTRPNITAKLFVVVVLVLAAVSILAQGQIAGDAAPEKAPDPTFIVGDPEGGPVAGDELDALTARVAALLRCPVCQGLSINDSPATMARNMKTQTRDLLAQGYSEEQVMTYFEKAYGEFVRLNPPKRGVNWFVWLSPVAFLLVGGFFIRGVVGRMSRKESQTDEPSAGAPGRDELPDDDSLREYVLRVRELAYGWPDGRAPAAEGESE